MSGDELVTLLAARKISQRQLAVKMDCDPASVHRLLTGKRAMRLCEAVELASLLRVPVGVVLACAGVPVGAVPRVVVLT